jgi:hypothetical protein
MFKLLLVLTISLPAFAALKFEPVKNYATKAEIEKIARAAAKAQEVLSSQCFADYISAQTMNQTNGRTAKEVVEHLRSLTDIVPVKMYTRRFSSAVAYRQPPHKTINLNRSFFKLSVSDCRWAATMMHEGHGHAIGGYGHSFDWTRQREDTVPYVLSGRKAKYGGDVFSKCCQ